VAAAYARGKTVVRDAAELRYKESDRIAKLCAELLHLGVDISEAEDGFSLEGGKAIQGGVATPHGDHRLAMSLMVAGLGAAQPIRIDGAETAGESFPRFAEVLQQLGAELKMEG
jgi:3-phosphoshikimate 1-carboxyvinyltransferase